MAKRIECGRCRRKFSGLAAYLWHFKVAGGCVEKPKPDHDAVCGPGCDCEDMVDRGR